ncbi:MAG: Na+:solute symporter [Opitutaceae bacterium]|jgi:solute:Na+ symporter, SSS family|nr:Na+:solute symporter [Opitutaceae bacterium]
MQSIDYVIILLYVIGIVAAGMVFAGKMKNSKEMFAAGGKSPWWVSGLSGFMTMFSAGTFVIWGGIAYQFGFVAVYINLGYGVAAMLVGMFLAGRWRKLGVDSAPEYLQMRFGPGIVQFYTWFKGIVNLFAMGGGVFALSKIICVLVPLSEGHLLADAATGHLSVPLTSIALCVMVIVITCSGGLWAVLMTDVLQFVILTVSVVFVVPLILMEAGGWTAFIDATPEGFTSPIASDYTWWFIIGWMVVNFFNIGGEWTFVQRYMCVPTAKDAKKAAFLFGTLYLVSPLIWMLPPLVYRVLNDSAEPAEAYVLACRHVLPAGMMGLMVAAMASATASMATTRLNTFSGAITSEVYHRVINRTASDSQLVFVGRIATVVLGMVVTAGALLIPRYGYTSFIIDINTLLAGPMLLPGLWGLFSRKIGPFAVWSTIAAGAVVAYLVKFALAREGFLTTVDSLQPLVQWIAANSRIVDLTAGIVFPLVLMTTMELMTKHEHPGYAKVQEFSRKFHEEPDLQSSPLPAKIVAISLVIIAAVMLVLAVLDPADANVLGSLAVVLTTISGVIHWSIRRGEKAAA